MFNERIDDRIFQSLYLQCVGEDIQSNKAGEWYVVIDGLIVKLTRYIV